MNTTRGMVKTMKKRQTRLRPWLPHWMLHPWIRLMWLCVRGAPVIRTASKLFLSAGAQFGFPFLWPFQIRQEAGEQANRWEERTDSINERYVGYVCQLAYQGRADAAHSERKSEKQACNHADPAWQ